MPAVEDPNSVAFTARNGFRSKVTAHPPTDTPPFFVVFSDAWCDQQGRIRKRFGRAAVGASAGATITQLWEYEYVDPSTGASTFYVFRTFGTVIQRWNGSAWVSETLPYTPNSGVFWQFLNFKNRLFAVNGDTDATKGQMIVFDPASTPLWRTVGQSAPAAGFSGYTLAGTYAVGTVSCTQGSAVINSAGGTLWDISGAWSGKWIDINGNRYKISNVNSNTQIQLTEGFKEATLPGLTYAIYFGLMDWVTPPRYAYAYYNPTTGHVSNASPILQLVEQNVVGQTPTLNIAGSAQNTAAYNAGYTQLKIFRAAQNAYRPVAIQVFAVNNNTNSAISFVETPSTYQDVDLTDLAIPINTNGVPPVGIVSLAEYQGRICGIKPTGDAATPPAFFPGWYFSAIDDELPFGRGEEAWPARFRRNVTRAKQVISIGSGAISNALVISSGNGDYTFDGVDNLSYTNPLRLKTRASGGFLGGAIEAHGGLVQLYRDKRVYDFGISSLAQYWQAQSGRAGTDLFSPCQDRLDALNAAAVTGSRLSWFCYSTIDLLFASFPKGVGQATNNYTLIFDYDEGQIYEWQFGFTAATTVHNTTTGDLEFWCADAAGQVYKINTNATQFDDNGTPYQPRIKTSHIRREGLAEQLAIIELFVGPVASNPQNLSWTVNIYTDENPTTPFWTGVASAIGGIYENSQGMKLQALPEKPIRSHVMQVEVIFPSSSTDLSIDQMNVIFRDAADAAQTP